MSETRIPPAPITGLKGALIQRAAKKTLGQSPAPSGGSTGTTRR